MDTEHKYDLILDRFFHRTNAIAAYPEFTQYVNGDLRQYLKKHFTGEQRIGAYSTADDSTVKWAVVDLDNKDGDKTELNWQYVQKYVELISHVFHVLIEKSKSTEGAFHLWHFFEEPLSAKAVREVLVPFVSLVKEIISYPEMPEFFPKQSYLGDGQIGNMVWLPNFGGQDQTGYGREQGYTIYIDTEGQPRDPWQALLDVSLITLSDLDELQDLYQLERIQESVAPPAPDDVLSCFRGTHQGARNEHGFTLANYLVKQGLSKDFVLELLSLWNDRNDPPMDHQEVERIVASAFQRHAEDKQNPLDIAPKTYLEYIHEYQAFIQQTEHRVNIGITELDESIRSVRPGQVMTLLGYTGVGKTAIAQAIFHHYVKHAKRPVLFFSQEMPGIEVFERAMQMEAGITGKMVEYAAANEGFESQVQESLAGVRNVYIYDYPHLTWEEIAEIVEQSEMHVYGDKTGLIVVDYLGLMKGTGKDTYEKMTSIALDMKNTAKALNIPIIALSQITTDSAEKAVQLSQARDSKAIVHASDYVVGIYREEEEYPKQIGIHLALLKNRKGPLMSCTRYLNKQTLQLEPYLE